jgi:hypothetical protein
MCLYNTTLTSASACIAVLPQPPPSTQTGNDGGELLTGTMPAACPDALSVTSIASDDSPSYFSNIARNDSPDNIKSKTVAAPGSSIYSTFNNGGYMTLSGVV